jgi:4-hydroxybenzoate polyprenyltransferase/phosphoserine phosphatase
MTAEPRLLPLAVDLDGTLLRSDMIVETASVVAGTRPLAALAALAELRHGRAALKARLAALGAPDPATLPWNEELLALLRAERARGRRLFLASAADRRVVQAVADHLGLFDGVFASDGTTNRKGAAKAEQLVAAFGAGGFAYAGNESADFPVWQAAGERLVVNASAAVRRRALAIWPDAVIVSPPARPGVRVLARAMRVHQWLKNALLLLPALAAHRAGAPVAAACLLGFLAFSLTASAIYLCNDMVDLSRDRAHPSKRRRPLASGALPVRLAVGMVPVLLGAALVLALPLPGGFLRVLVLYAVTTTAYSLFLKRIMMVDVVTLACLYGLRLYAGAVATAVPISAWMVAFALFLFTSLAIVKRCTELIGRAQAGRGDPPGRDYRLGDVPMLQALAAGSGFTAVLVLALYVNGPDVALLYRHPGRLWLLAVVLIYWLGRVLLLTARGEMRDDPVVFAATDRISLGCGVVGLLAVLAAM